MSRRVWMKYHEKWAWGDSQDSCEMFWVKAETDEEAEEEVRWWFEEHGEQFNYSDKFRGVDWGVDIGPDSDYLLRKIECNKRTIEHLKRLNEHLTTDVHAALEREKTNEKSTT